MIHDSMEGKPADAGSQRLTPDRVPITERQAMRLSKLTSVPAKELSKRTIADLADRFKWQIDPHLFLFEQICGKVVKTDPATGVDYPVPHATVHVMDTDCSLLGFFPVEAPWCWFFPIFCHQEEIGSAVTDDCGNFCVWVPRFDIDWILRFRREHHCYGTIFRKPSIADLLEKLRKIPPDVVIGPHRPGPVPGPGPVEFVKDGGASFRALEGLLGRDMALKVGATGASELGTPTQGLSEILERPAFSQRMPPPLPHRVKQMHAAKEGERAKLLAEHFSIAEQHAVNFNPYHYCGPFFRCEDVWVAEWVPFFDVPDISFNVTQDVNGDGVEEPIYTEGLFDVRWDSGPIPAVTLHASQVAVSNTACNVPDVGPCAVPGIYLVGFMPLVNPTGMGTFNYIDTTTGYAVRANRPHASGRSNEVPAAATAAAAPLGGLLNFWGCNHVASDGAPAHYYKVLIETSTNGGGTWGPQVPIFDNWLLFRFVGNPVHLEYKPIAANGAGWYPVVDPVEQWLPSANLILQWHGAPTGMHRLTLQLGDNGHNIIETRPPVVLEVDNSGAHAEFTSLEYRILPFGAWNTVDMHFCPTIHRGGQSIQLRIGIHAWANNLRSVETGFSGCGGGSPILVSGLEGAQSGVPMGAHTTSYWHKNANDNGLSSFVVWEVDEGTHPPGAYTFVLTSHSRAFNPDDGHLFDPTHADVDYIPILSWYPTSLPVAIVE